MIERLIKLIRRKWANISFRKKVNIRLKKPIVSFTFDDVPISAFINGGGVLSKYGFGGTFYVSLSLMTGPDPDTRFTVQHLKDAIAQGHEIGGHTYSHTDLAQATASEGIADMKKNRTEMAKLIPGAKLLNFSYPFGSQTRPLKKYVSTKYRSARGIEEGINVRGADLFNLKTVKLYERKHSLDYIFHKISEAEKNNGWLIFYTHDVDENYTDWGCSPAYFEKIVNECAKRGITVATVDAALNLIESNTKHES